MVEFIIQIKITFKQTVTFVLQIRGKKQCYDKSNNSRTNQPIDEHYHRFTCDLNICSPNKLETFPKMWKMYGFRVIEPMEFICGKTYDF